MALCVLVIIISFIWFYESWLSLLLPGCLTLNNRTIWFGFRCEECLSKQKYWRICVPGQLFNVCSSRPWAFKFYVLVWSWHPAPHSSMKPQALGVSKMHKPASSSASVNVLKLCKGHFIFCQTCLQRPSVDVKAWPSLAGSHMLQVGLM